MNTPTLQELREAFPDRIPDSVTSVRFAADEISDPAVLNRSREYIEWIGFWRGLAVGIKRAVFGHDSWAQIVVTTATAYGLFVGSPLHTSLNAGLEKIKNVACYSELVPPRFVHFGEFPPFPKDEAPEEPVLFHSPVISGSISDGGDFPNVIIV